MYYNNIEDIRKDIFNQKLLFENQLMKNSYKKSIISHSGYGNLTTIHNYDVPVTIINLSPTFNISEKKANLVKKIMNKIIKDSDTIPYITYVYKNNIDRKNVVIDSEFSYNSIKSTYDELIYIINNIYRHFDNILFVYLGRYAEYNYLNNMIVCSNNLSNINSIYNKHISQFLTDSYNDNKELNSDIDRIKNKVISLSKKRV